MQLSLHSFAKLISFSNQMEAWTKMGSIMDSIHSYDHSHFIGNEGERRQTLYLQIFQLFEAYLNQFGTKEILAILIRKPDLADDVETQYNPKTNTDYQIKHTCFWLYMDMRFTRKQYLCFKYRKHAAIITTLPYKRIMNYFPKIDPFENAYENMNLKQIQDIFDHIELALSMQHDFNKNLKNDSNNSNSQIFF